MKRPLSVFVPAHVRLAMVLHAEREAPAECCGLLVGRGRRVVLAVPATNVDPDRHRRFLIDPVEHIALRRALRRRGAGLAIIGAYHSHPGGRAAPSTTDITESHYPDWFYVILARRGRAMNAFRIADGRARRIAMTPR